VVVLGEARSLRSMAPTLCCGRDDIVNLGATTATIKPDVFRLMRRKQLDSY
jgi:hypothetical protein